MTTLEHSGINDNLPVIKRATKIQIFMLFLQSGTGLYTIVAMWALAKSYRSGHYVGTGQHALSWQHTPSEAVGQTSALTFSTDSGTPCPVQTYAPVGRE